MMYIVELLDEDTLECLYSCQPLDLAEARLEMARITSSIRPGEYLRLMELVDEDLEDEGQPDEAQEWYDYDPDC